MLTNRQLQILQAIVDDFIMFAQPVGSRQISKKQEITFSPATIRNEMADLEELGFLEKTHTSSGRVPSEKGYRFYVDHLLSPQGINSRDIQQIQSIFNDRLVEVEHIIRKSANILSELTSYTSILLGPDVQTHRVKRFSIVPLSSDSAVAIIVTNNGHVENRMFSLPPNFAASDLEKMVNVLNERLVGVSLEDIHKKLEAEVLSVLQQHVRSADDFIHALVTATMHNSESKIFYGGKTNMFNQPEFHDLNKVRMILDLMETTSQVQSLFHPNESGIQIRIGSENKQLEMENCSVITTTYSIGEDQQGAIAIIGPTRMDYKRVVALLDVMRMDLTQAFTKNRSD
ncbi:MULTISPECIES: heat-inducible transcriptional repressor HrcA [unclassified Lysinibacillus]|uniref:heat-inducible transcriptional repressor HrcA n=1 Tax=unclassified Lysinibacillus TaxID=2636778 RepID=UPI0020121BC4|nr:MULTISPECIES: heat-inducible transcriptional repressor HrcA [unclassified Lysinibacillus]MCL1694883.1 heat-inducible transcriptional repressor HrcA [Lysinibacillus sp. BPa_S21]MCL1701446.1 heat-inducible transcriptional repressor HrcA [Lysinibacillus sp. Bpr_S20]